MKKLFSTLIVLAHFTSCTSEEPNPQYVFERKIEKMEMESFKIPDSINTSLIIASYYNEDNHSQILFLYSDTLKKSAKKIEFLSDSLASTENLEILKRNEFRSKSSPIDYVIEENSVCIIHQVNCSGVTPTFGKEYRRTDRD